MSLQVKNYAEYLAKLNDLAPDQTKAFNEFNDSVFKDGTLSTKEKEIIAVAVAHDTQCPYCIEMHTKNAKKAGATLEELVEAVYVTSSIEAGAVVTHSTHVHNVNVDDAPDSLYNRSNLDHLKELAKHDRDGFKGYQGFSAAGTQEGKLSAKFKEIIAVAIGHSTQCPYCIEVHTKNADEQGATSDELAEAISVTSAMRAGGPYAHMSNLIKTFEEN